jgi:hypothetical protein
VKAHLVGSIGLDSVEDVFAKLGPALGAYLRRIPDREVGGRKISISWQYPLLRAQPFLMPDHLRRNPPDQSISASVPGRRREVRGRALR